MLTARPRTRGFTLIEVAVVLVVLAILAAIAIPTFAAFMDRTDQNAAEFSVQQAMQSVEAKSALDGSIYPLDYTNDVVPVFSNELTGDNAPTAAHYNAATGVLTVTVAGSRGTYSYFVDLSDGQFVTGYVAAAAALVEAPASPRVAVAPASADPSVLGIDLVDDAGSYYLVFDANQYTNVRVSRVTGSPGSLTWSSWQTLQASGTYDWPAGGNVDGYEPLVMLAVETSLDGGSTWSDLRYVWLAEAAQSWSGQYQATVADQTQWIGFRDSWGLSNHPDDDYTY